jgi:hypothetical protein
MDALVARHLDAVETANGAERDARSERQIQEALPHGP